MIGRGGRAAFARHATLAPTLIVVGLFFCAPLALVVADSFGVQAYLSRHIAYPPTLEQYRTIVHAPYSQTIIRSIGLATLTAFGCLVVAYAPAYVIARRSGRWRNLLLCLVIVPFWTSFLIRTYAWTNILATDGELSHWLRAIGLTHGSLGLLYTWKGVAIGMIYSYLPLMIFPLYASLHRIDERLLEAASDLGASRMRVFRRIVIPQSMPGVLAGLVIVGAPATAEYLVPQILGGGRFLLLGNLVGQEFGTSFNWPLGAALSVTAMLELAILVFVVARLMGGRRGFQQLA